MKTSHITHGIFALVCATALFFSCQKDEKLPFETDAPKLPAESFQYASGGFVVGNPNNLSSVTNSGATLGRVLFYDKKLSLNNTVACGSCHKQALGFADAGATSTGFKGANTTRNSLALSNLSNEFQFFWDMRTSSLEDLVLQPIGNHIEMGLDNTENLIKKLSRTSYYPELFNKAFGTPEITDERISKAVAQFLRAMVSKNSKFDQSQSWNGNTLADSERRGWDLFFNQLHCSGCHNGSDFNQSGFGQNIGLDTQYKDNGLGKQTGESFLNGVFKVPSLRNVALSAPYMHDGRFKTLEDVVEHYNSGVQNHTNLSKTLKGFMWTGNGGSVKTQGCWSCGVGEGGDNFRNLNMTKEQKADLITFLKTLTDENFVTDVRYSNPFTQ
jgi:cytochrome c peroxidase